MSGRGGFNPAGGEDDDEGGERMVDAVLAGVQWRDVTVPRTKYRGKMRILKRTEESAVRVEVRRELAETHGITSDRPNVLETFPEWNEERVLRVLAIAIRHPRNPARPLATIDEWSECDDLQLGALWQAYKDFEAELDPLGANGPGLTPGELEELKAAAGKGDVDLLMSYGSRKLALFISSSVAQPAS